MTKQFHEGQEVEVPDVLINGQPISWRKAKIVRQSAPELPHVNEPAQYDVQFPDGSRAVFDAEHIRTDDKIPTKAHLKLGREIGLL